MDTFSSFFFFFFWFSYLHDHFPSRVCYVLPMKIRSNHETLAIIFSINDMLICQPVWRTVDLVFVLLSSYNMV